MFDEQLKPGTLIKFGFPGSVVPALLLSFDLLNVIGHFSGSDVGMFIARNSDHFAIVLLHGKIGVVAISEFIAFGGTFEALNET